MKLKCLFLSLNKWQYGFLFWFCRWNSNRNFNIHANQKFYRIQLILYIRWYVQNGITFRMTLKIWWTDAASLDECLDQFRAKEWAERDNMYKRDGNFFFSIINLFIWFFHFLFHFTCLCSWRKNRDEGSTVFIFQYSLYDWQLSHCSASINF